MSLQIKWLETPARVWLDIFTACPRTTLLQAPPYGITTAHLNNQCVRWAIIEKNNTPAGCFQMQEARLFKMLLHAFWLDRGPLWLPGYQTTENLADFATELDKAFPARFGRRRRFIPEYSDMPAGAFKRNTYIPPYQTLWWSLERTEEDLRAGMRKNWRNALSKAERTEIEITFACTQTVLKEILHLYMQDKKVRGYRGASPNMLRALLEAFSKTNDVIVARALYEGKCIAFVLIFCHGLAATYQTGWSSDTGRKNNATHRLLWESVKELRKRNIQSLDLGGINEDTKGLEQFKKGTGAHATTLCGLYH